MKIEISSQPFEKFSIIKVKKTPLSDCWVFHACRQERRAGGQTEQTEYTPRRMANTKKGSPTKGVPALIDWLPVSYYFIRFSEIIV
jgi:hypothetical protein